MPLHPLTSRTGTCRGEPLDRVSISTKRLDHLPELLSVLRRGSERFPRRSIGMYHWNHSEERNRLLLERGRTGGVSVVEDTEPGDKGASRRWF